MRIRTRYKLFRAIIALAVLIFLASLYDMFLNRSDWRNYIIVGYVALAVLALLLYVGYKPKLDEEPTPAMEAVPEPAPTPAPVEPLQVEAAPPPEPYDVQEIPRPVTSLAELEGAQQFQCPFCRGTFGLELTHLTREADFRLSCPYCQKRIRVTQRPNVTRAPLVNLSGAMAEERAVFTCNECGEVLRITAPGSQPERSLSIEACPHCRSSRVVAAAAAT